MKKIFLYNFLCFLIFFTLGSYFLHWYFLDAKVKIAMDRIKLYKKNPYYNKITEKIGNLSVENLPTSYLNITPNPNKIRIGFFGDSHTMGDEVKPGHDFPSVLQKIIGTKYQIINFGQGGYNSNQIYLMADYFSQVFDLDIIVLGPRGFYTKRLTTFNNYWNQGNIPYSRFILKNGKLTSIEVAGPSMEEKILRYYSFFPDLTLIRYDHVAPSFLKLSDLLFSKEIINPYSIFFII